MAPPPPRVPQILVVDRAWANKGSTLRLGRTNRHDVVADVVATISEALTALSRAGYDAVLLRIDEAEETSLLLRIKASAPQTMLLALVPDENHNLENLARESGADAVLQTRQDSLGALAEAAQALETTQSLIERSQLALQKTRALQERMTELLARGKPVRAKSFDLAQIPVGEYRPLLVEDDADQALLFARSCRKAKLPFSLPVMTDGEEAIAYLRGDGKYQDRSVHPLPTLTILDLHLPRKSGLEVLAWIRSQPALRGHIVFVLTSSPLKEDFDNALRLGAHYYFIKPISLDGLSEVAKVIAMRWALIRRAQGLPMDPPKP